MNKGNQSKFRRNVRILLGIIFILLVAIVYFSVKDLIVKNKLSPNSKDQNPALMVKNGSEDNELEKERAAIQAAPESNPKTSSKPTNTGSVEQTSDPEKSKIVTPPDARFGTCADYYSKGIYVLERKSGEEVFSCGAEESLVPASLVKMMTVLVGIENSPNLDIVTPIDVDNYLAMVEANASMAGFVGNEPVTMRDLFYGTMLPSGGEASASLALHVAGSKENFVQLMNEKAQTLGLENTSFANESGLDAPGNYSTAKDMAILLDNALDNETFYEVFTSSSYQSTVTEDHPEGVLMYSTVLAYISPKYMEEQGFQILGGKSGTELAGQNWATYGVKNNKEYIVIVMGAELGSLDEPNNYQILDTLKLFEAIP